MTHRADIYEATSLASEDGDGCLFVVFEEVLS